jgi:hypothetical protein
MDHREKLYVKDSGLKEGSKTTLTTQPLDPNMDIMSSTDIKFGRLLASPEPRQRHKSVLKLKAYLKARATGHGLSELDLLKLWKALWYTLYMADKQAVQHELSKQLAQLIWCVAGTQEEDDYAAAMYLEMTSKENDDDDDDSEEEDDDAAITLEEIENTLDDAPPSNDNFNSHKSISDDDDDGNNEKNGSKEEHESKAIEVRAEENGDMLVEEEEHDEDNEEDLQKIPHCRGVHLASLFLRTFFHTIRRDWDTMDKYRVDKFYTLIRLMMHQVFRYMAERHWNNGIIRLFNDVLFDEILNQRPNGLRYHLIDLTLDELAKVSSTAPLPLSEATMLDVLEPYLGMCQSGLDDDTLQARVMEKIIENFLDNYSIVSDKALKRIEGKDNEEGSDDIAEQPILDQVHVGTVAELLFGLASDPATKDKHRKGLYDMHKKYVRRVKQVGKDVELGPPEEEGDEDEEDQEHDVGMITSQIQKDENENDTVEDFSNGSSSSKKRKSDEVDNAEEQNIEIPVKTPSKQKRKRKKNKRNSEAKAENMGGKEEVRSSTQNEEEEEEEVVITLSEQQAAKKAVAQKKKLKKSKQKTSMKQDENSLSSSKRVKFDRVNRSKSHKASVKALVTSVPPKTKDRTPEKGILRNKKRASPGDVLLKKGRKKAVNYF